jgi:hypothetical protein
MLIGGPILLGAVALFYLEIRAIMPFNGWWLDELFSVWSSDPSLGFSDAFLHRILEDTTPPLYYSALFWTRRIIADERDAIIFLNVISLFAGLFCVGVASRRAGCLGWALVAGAFFLVSGPVLRYAPEGRAYLMAMAVTFVVTWLCSLAVQISDKRPHPLSFAVIGVLAAIIHVYAALICVCFAAGMVALSLLTKTRHLFVAGMVLGFATCTITAVYLPFGLESVDRIRWTELSVQSLIDVYWQIRMMALGSRLGVLLLITLFFAGLRLPTTRTLAGVFGVAFLLFLLLPILVSLEKPIVGSRYWLIGAPAILVFTCFVTREFVASAERQVRGRRCWIGALTGLSFLVIADGVGFAAARADTASKLIWRGAELAGPLLRHCQSKSVHVYTSWGFVPGFAFVAHAPEALFVNVQDPASEWMEPKDFDCPVLGWAEHVVYRGAERLQGDFVFNANNDELLNLLKIRASPSQVEIHRHQYGYVVLRRGTLER